MAKILSQGLDVSIARRDASELLGKFQTMSKGIVQDDPIFSRARQNISDILNRWSEEGKRATLDIRALDQLFREHLVRNAEKFSAGLEDATKEIQRFSRSAMRLGQGMGHVETQLEQAAAPTGTAAAGGGGMGFLGRFALGSAAILGTAALVAGYEGTKVTFQAAFEEQARRQQIAMLGVRSGSYREFARFTQNLNSDYGMDPTEASKFALGLLRGGTSGIGDLRAGTNTAARVTRMLGLSSEQGAAAFGSLNRAGVDRRQWEELGNIIGESAAKAGLGGREGEMLDAIAKGMDSISRFVLFTRGTTEANQTSTNAGNFLDTLNRTGYTGLQGAAGYEFAERFTNSVRAKGFQLPDASSAFIQLALLQSAGAGGVGKAMEMQAGMNPGSPQAFEVFQRSISNMRSIMGGGNKNPIGRGIETMLATQLLGVAATPEQVDKFLSLTKSGTATDKAAREAFGKQATQQSREAIEESNTAALVDLSKELSKLGTDMQPILRQLIGVGDHLVTDLDKIVNIIPGAEKKTKGAMDAAGKFAGDYLNFTPEGIPPGIKALGGKIENTTLDDVKNAVMQIVNYIVKNAIAGPPSPANPGAPSGKIPVK